jgi:hypothetical protein
VQLSAKDSTYIGIINKVQSGKRKQDVGVGVESRDIYSHSHPQDFTTSTDKSNKHSVAHKGYGSRTQSVRDNRNRSMRLCIQERAVVEILFAATMAHATVDQMCAHSALIRVNYKDLVSSTYELYSYDASCIHSCTIIWAM